MPKEWQYSPDWSESELMNGSYCGFVYIFEFADSSIYVGSKQIYERVKDAKKIKPTSKEYPWREYSSSSKTVNQKIADGESYTKTILWAFPTMRETLLVESILILNQILKPQCLNIAMMNKVRAPSYDMKKRLMGIVQELLSWLN